MTSHSASATNEYAHGGAHQLLRLRRLGIDTYQEHVIYMRSDCHVCKSEGFDAPSRVEVTHGERHIIATLNVVTSPLLDMGEAGLSESAWHALAATEGGQVQVRHPAPVQSFSQVRAKIYGKSISDESAGAIIRDIVRGDYSNLQIASFISACAGERLDIAETIALTRAMVEVGGRLQWDQHPIGDKHCVGGLPGNRTTPLVVAIVAACGLIIPKTSSRAITSPAGTADVMETLAPVNLNIQQIRAVVAREGGCIAWGGAVNLSPADDILIRVERPLDLDSDGQLVASVLSKKIAVGSSHVLIDIPVGSTAKVRSLASAQRIRSMLTAVGDTFGLTVKVLLSDGAQPVGRGIGPALEALDVLAVLQNQADAPADLRQRSLLLAAGVLELGQKARPGEGLAMAAAALDSGAAWKKFQAICDAQGGMRTPPLATYRHDLIAPRRGRVLAIDNRRIVRIAKLAGAPKASAAGLLFHAPLGRLLDAGEPYLTICAESPGELAYARAYAESQTNVIELAEA
ncbi:thymidine phosphorylase family protein [Undibacterium sp.]|uniref:thymidine phosphorylase family protein n=1 Tax=Undibacterium sp. TaxID=1914977 RepID=UPI0025E4A43A|nr:thymidine phosphorylase family protein [Undibacterium sp.]